ncbi:DUF998 domain-containing protein [Glaciihabitans sp. dw_435]|uniref:DUF998 domain-containing protein n=1 Tax=Glaciihabitans sp. dw_435 TaxID=2720081 RepID=UPI001BD68BFF|nr:DUF998 domain-containing protein [Glaciihabitans sp. dw_435]
MSDTGHRRIALSAIHLESRTLQVAFIAAAIGAVISAIVFWDGDVALSGAWSVGTVAAIVGGALGTTSFVVAYLSTLPPMSVPGDDRLRLARRVLDTCALALNHLAIWAILSLGTFAILQRAFEGLEVDLLTATILVSVVVGIGAYFMQASAATISAFRVSTLLSIFIVAGMLASMITAPDPGWWKLNFSALGTMAGFSGFAFNFTLIATGLLVVTLADYVTADLRRWASRRPDYQPKRVSAVGWGLVALGVFLGAVGIFPVDRFLALHNTVATGMVVVFVGLVVALRFVLPGFPPTFYWLGYGFLVAIVVVTLLFYPIGYYNLTALELVAASVILGWIVILIRTVAALRRDLDSADNPSQAPVTAGLR